MKKQIPEILDSLILFFERAAFGFPENIGLALTAILTIGIPMAVSFGLGVLFERRRALKKQLRRLP